MYKSRVILLKCLILVMIILSLFIGYNHIKIYEINKQILLNEDMLKVSNIDIKDLEYINKNLLELKLLENYYSIRESVFILITIVIPIIAVFIDFILKFKEKQNELEKEIIIIAYDMQNFLYYIFSSLSSILMLNEIIAKRESRLRENDTYDVEKRNNLLYGLTHSESKSSIDIYYKLSDYVSELRKLKKIDIMKYNSFIKILSKSDINAILIYNKIVEDYKSTLIPMVEMYVELSENNFKNIKDSMLLKMSLIANGWHCTYKILFIDNYDCFIDFFKKLDKNITDNNISENNCVDYYISIKEYIDEDIKPYYD